MRERELLAREAKEISKSKEELEREKESFEITREAIKEAEANSSARKIASIDSQAECLRNSIRVAEPRENKDNSTDELEKLRME